MLLTWLRNRRRRKLLAAPFPSAWSLVLAEIAHYRLLNTDEKARLHALTRIIVAERTFEGCRGLEITDEIRVTIAALASILLLGLRDFYFDNVPTILVYPEAYVAPDQRSVGGVVLETESDRLGEAHYRGPLLLSWADVNWDARHAGQGSNLVFHEFAHQLDMLNGSADGVPLLPRSLRERWQSVMAREHDHLRRASARGQNTFLDPYGATDPAEFFAVVTEAFFDTPQELQGRHAELYDLLHAYYGQDPSRRSSS